MDDRLRSPREGRRSGLARRLSPLAPWVWAALLVLDVVVSLIPSAPLPSVDHADKAAHLAGYLVLALIPPWLMRLKALAVALGLVALSGGLELLQGSTGRQPSWADLAANALGVLAGTLLGLAMAGRLGPGDRPHRSGRSGRTRRFGR